MIKRVILGLLALFSLLAVMILLGTFQTSDVIAASNDTITVDTLIDEFDESCIDGDCSLRDAIYVASDGDTINFSVNGTIDISDYGQLTIQDDLTIDGGHAITITGRNKSRVFQVGYSSNIADVNLIGLTISEGQKLVNSNCGVPCGGGIYVDTNSILTLTHSSIISNTGFMGGGIYNLGGSVIISNSNLSSNFANYSVDSIGGAIYNSGNEGSATLTIVNSTLSGNSASKDGGGIFNVGAGNSATVAIINSTFSGNSANSNGGGVFNILGSGGSAMVTISNSTFSGNFASDIGGAVYNKDGLVTVNNSTISNNRVGNDGGGIHSFGNAVTSSTLTNTIVSGNIVSGTNTYNDLTVSYDGYMDSFHSGGNNLIGTIHEMNSEITAFDQVGDQTGIDDPKLNSLADNGGDSFTHALQSGSPALDAGDCTNGPTYDQRGVPRPQNDTCDIGSFEGIVDKSYVFLPIILRSEIGAQK